MNHLTQEWAEFLSQFPWDWYGHLTFKGYPHLEAANKTFNFWRHKLNKKIFGSNYWKHPEKGVFYARATEFQKRGAPHYHFVAGGIPNDVSSPLWAEEWSKLGGISLIYPYKPLRGAEFYLSKATYAWEKGEIDIGGPVLRLTR